MAESTAKMRSGRIVAESKHKAKRLVMEAEAALHSNGSAFAETSEIEQVHGGLVVEVAAIAAVHQLVNDTNAPASDHEHEEMRLYVGGCIDTPFDWNAFAESTELNHADGRDCCWSLSSNFSRLGMHLPNPLSSRTGSRSSTRS